MEGKTENLTEEDKEIVRQIRVFVKGSTQSTVYFQEIITRLRQLQFLMAICSYILGSKKLND